MIERKVEKREDLVWDIGVVMFSVYLDCYIVLYDIFDNGKEFAEIWIPYKEVTHG